MIFNLADPIAPLEPPYSRAARGVIGQAFCANWETISGFWRGKFGIAGGWAAYVQAFRDCNADFGGGTSGSGGASLDFAGVPPFVGGQCSVFYNVTVRFRTPVGTAASVVLARGPISGLAIRAGSSSGSGVGERLVVLGTSAEGEEQEFQAQQTSNTDYFSDEYIDGVVRQDGAADNCGDPDDEYPQFPDSVPSPDPPSGEPDGAPVLVPAMGDVTVPITFEGDTYNFDFNVGDITVKDNGNINIDLDGRGWGVNPGLDVFSPDDLVQDVVDDLIPDIDAQILLLQAQLETLRVQLQCVIADSCSFEEYLVEVPVCGGEVVSLQTGGVGTNKVIDVFLDTMLAVNSNILSVCDAEPEPTPDVGRIALYSQTVISDNEAGSPNPLSDDVFYVDVEFTKIADSNKVYKSGLDGERQGRFGYLVQGFLLGNERLWGAPQPLWFEKNRIKIDRSYDGVVYIRISSHVGNQFSVYDSGIRL